MHPLNKCSEFEMHKHILIVMILLNLYCGSAWQISAALEFFSPLKIEHNLGLSPSVCFALRFKSGAAIVQISLCSCNLGNLYGVNFLVECICGIMVWFSFG